MHTSCLTVCEYYTDWVYGGVSLTVVEDRKWKSGPGEFGDMLNPPGADLLGARQEYFLNEWANRTESDELRIVMSATIFSRPSTHVGKDLVESRLDKDSNGWPKSGRDRALRPLMNNPNTIMLHGRSFRSTHSTVDHYGMGRNGL
jgi:alkaline phosphatase D